MSDNDAMKSVGADEVSGGVPRGEIKALIQEWKRKAEAGDAQGPYIDGIDEGRLRCAAELEGVLKGNDE